VPAVRPDLIEPEAGLLPERRRLRDAAVPQGLIPDVHPDALPERAHNPQDAARLEAPVSPSAAKTPRLKERLPRCVRYR
jgi:hypothetical protein